MPKIYRCDIYFSGHVPVYVEAESPEEASSKSNEEFENLDSRELEANVEYTEVQDIEEDEDD